MPVTWLTFSENSKVFVDKITQFTVVFYKGMF